jgi:hypothetical protein
MKIGDKYIVPSGTKLWFISLQTSMITTEKYVIEVNQTITSNNTSFFGFLHDIIYEHHGFPGLLKKHNGEVSCDLSLVLPLGNILEPKL